MEAFTYLSTVTTTTEKTLSGVGPPCNHNPLHLICRQAPVFTWQGHVVYAALAVAVVVLIGWSIRRVMGR